MTPIISLQSLKSCIWSVPLMQLLPQGLENVYETSGLFIFKSLFRKPVFKSPKEKFEF